MGCSNAIEKLPKAIEKYRSQLGLVRNGSCLMNESKRIAARKKRKKKKK